MLIVLLMFQGARKHEGSKVLYVLVFWCIPAGVVIETLSAGIFMVCFERYKGIPLLVRVSVALCHWRFST